MAFQEDLEKSGRGLFKLRSYIPVVLLPVLALALRDLRYARGAGGSDELWLTFCLSIGMLGLLLRCIAVGYAAPGTSGRGTQQPYADHLNTTGMYSIVRHPLYVGNYFLWLGPALYPRSWSAALIITLAFALYYERVILAEEAFLRRKFGCRFEEWAASTPALIPRLRLWQPPDRAISIRTILKRECWGLVGLLLVLAGLESVRDLFLSRALKPDPLSVAFVATATLIAVSVRVQKSWTRYQRSTANR